MLIAAYHLFCFTEWIDDFERRFELGWSLVIIIVLNILVNMTILTFYVCRSAIAKVRRTYRKRIWTKRMRAYIVKKSRVEGRKYLTID